MNYWVTSDLHLGHKNICQYDKRDFKTLDEHDWYIINTFNENVSKEDIVYILGDFSLCNKSKTELYLQHLRGNLHFIKGNHDKQDNIKLFGKYGVYLGEQKKIKLNDVPIILNHFSMRVWEGSHKGSIHLYGHSHDTLEAHPWGKSMDVSVVTAKRILGEYRPFNIEKEIFPIMDKRPIKLIDRHGTGRT